MLTQNHYRAVPFTVLSRLPVFALVMMWNIIRANVEVALVVLNPCLPISPRIFIFKTRLEGDFCKAVLANCITLTPGTLTVDIQDNILYVHGLTEHNEESLIRGELERIVAWLFGQKL
jgi:multicomponent Na+:H+ antiporter subunit E